MTSPIAEDPIAVDARRHRRAQNSLIVLDLLHKVWGGIALLLGGTMFFFNLRQIIREIRRSNAVPLDEVGWMALGAIFILYALITFVSAHLIERRKARMFSLAWGIAHGLTIVGLPLALVTWLILRRDVVLEAYGDRPSTFQPRR
jgi:hypothetical protein